MDDPENDVKGLKSLVVWQKALQFAIFICKDFLPKFPDNEKWALTSQLRRSVQSVPANIAEGYGSELSRRNSIRIYRERFT